MSSNLHRNSTEANKHTPKGFDLANNNSTLLRDERGQSRYVDNLVNERVENLVDGNSAPPTTTSGHLYVLIDEGSGSVHADWNGANYDDIVRIQDGVWASITPVSGYLVFNKTDGKYYAFNGSSWVQFIPDSQNIYTNNGTVGAGRVVTLTDTLSFSGGRVSFDTTTNGILLPRLTTAQMNAIASPATNLLVFNTDLNGLYRYTGSAWVALSAGYGIIEVRDSSGYPTFYADLQTAINATGDVDTIYIYSDIQVTAQISIPNRTSLTIEMNGHRIWCNTTSGDFNLFRVTANSGNPQRHLRFEGGGLIEQTGTVSSVVNSAIIHMLNVGTTPMELFLGTTIFRAENARVMYSNGFTNLDGGYLIATNDTIEISANVFNSYWDCYETCNLPNTSKIKNTILKTRYGGYFAPSGGGGELENCHIEGDVTKSGNFGLLYVNGASNVRNCFLRQTHATGRDALYVRGSGSGGDISNNVCINLGTSAAGNFVFGAGSHNYFYSNGGNGLIVGANCTRFNDNICITNGATTQRALDCQGTIIYNNTAINLNAANTVEAMYVGKTSGTCQIYNNRAQVTNAAAYNIKFYTGGTIYFANNVMGLVGLGINPSPALTNSQTNTPDAYGNIKIG